jgi:agmatine deiminase
VLAIPLPADDDANARVFADARKRAFDFGITVLDVPSLGRMEGQDGLPAPASYMNFYIGNASVVVPTYGAPSDSAAVAAIARLFPRHQTVGLPANALLSGGGSFHCISQQVPSL